MFVVVVALYGCLFVAVVCCLLFVAVVFVAVVFVCRCCMFVAVCCSLHVARCSLLLLSLLVGVVVCS